MVAEAKKSETAVNTVERHPPAKANPFADVRFVQFAAEGSAAHPFECVRTGVAGGRKWQFGSGWSENFGRGSRSINGGKSAFEEKSRIIQFWRAEEDDMKMRRKG